MIYFHCPKPGTPSGGVWMIHRLVQLLNELEIEARVWAPEPFDVYWDANPIDKNLITQSAQIGQGDTLVVPEVNWPPVQRDGVRNICFVQNYIWLNKDMYFSNPGEVLVCSRFLSNHMKRVFDVNVIGKVTPFLDEGVWQPSLKLKDSVLVMGRRYAKYPRMVDKLKANGFLVELVTEPISQKDLSAYLSACEYYVHLVYPEGFPMICLEAMRSGTLVVGTTGGGGNEFMFHQETAVVVQDPESGQYFSQDEFCQRIVDQLSILRSDAEKRVRIRDTAFEWSKRYTAEATKAELKGIFG